VEYLTFGQLAPVDLGVAEHAEQIFAVPPRRSSACCTQYLPRFAAPCWRVSSGEPDSTWYSASSQPIAMLPA
jgi:hypothetical protein